MKMILSVLMLMFPVLSFGQRYVNPVRVNMAPPVLRIETRPMSPSARHQWIAGYWGWRGGRHQWMTGHWALPPQPGYVWEPAEWVNQNGAWMFYDGHWRTGEVADPQLAYQPPPPPVQVQVVDVPPPAELEEVRPQTPFEGALWVPGYWHWNGGRHVWVAGRWSARPAGYAWEAQRWDHRADGRWAYRPGHWHPQDEREHEQHEREHEHDRHDHR